MGTADAGSQAWADNASTAWHNPAGMTKLKRSEVSAGLGFGRSKVQFDADADTPTGGNDGGDAGSIAPLASLTGVYKINEDWAAGLYAGGMVILICASPLFRLCMQALRTRFRFFNRMMSWME